MVLVQQVADPRIIRDSSHSSSLDRYWMKTWDKHFLILLYVYRASSYISR